MENVFLTLINLSYSAGWLILAVLLIRLLLRQAPRWILCALWGIVALRLICPFSLESVLSLLPSGEIVSPSIVFEATPEIETGIDLLNASINPILAKQYAATPTASVNPMQILIFIGTVIWLLGTAGMLLYTLISFWRLKRRVASATRLRDNIKQSEQVDSPFVLGILHPTVYLPYHMDSADMEYVIAHEKAHIRRLDPLWKLVGFMILSVYWFHPLIWASYVLFCRDMETACDECVIREMALDTRRAYSTALLNCSVRKRSLAACPLAFGEIGVKARIKNVMHYKKPAFWITVAAVLTCIVTAVCFLTVPPKTPELAEEPPGALSALLPVGTKTLTYDDVLRLSEKGAALTWEDFAEFARQDVGSGMYVAAFDIDEDFYLLMGDIKMTGKPMYIRLYHRPTDTFTDLFAGSVEQFLKEHGAVMSVAIAATVDAPRAAVDFATIFTQSLIVEYSQNGILPTDITITEARVISIEQMNTPAGNKSAYYIYQPEYRLRFDGEDLQNIHLSEGTRFEDGWLIITEPYFVLYCDRSSGQEEWTPHGTITKQALLASYGTAEMLDAYGDPYTAAAEEMKKAREESFLLFGQPLSEFADAAWRQACTAGEAAGITFDKDTMIIVRDSEENRAEFRFSARGNPDMIAIVIINEQMDGTYAVDPDKTAILSRTPAKKPGEG